MYIIHNNDKKVTKTFFNKDTNLRKPVPQSANLHISAAITRWNRHPFKSSQYNFQEKPKPMKKIYTNLQLTQRRPRKPLPCGTSHCANNKILHEHATRRDEIVPLVH